MNSGKLFWGSFLISVGVLFLLVKYEIILSSFDFIWNIWPLIFVFWGLSLIFKGNTYKPIISALFGIFIAIIIFGLIYSSFWEFNFDSDNKNTFTQKYSKELEVDVKTVNLSLESGAGVFVIKDTTSNLIDADSYGTLGKYEYYYSKEDSIANLDINMESKNVDAFRFKFKNELNIKLNTKPKWNFIFNVGASKNKFDLSPFKINNLRLSTGATSSKIKLGDKSDSTNVDIDMGASSLTLEIPKNVGCSINLELPLGSKKLRDFRKTEDGFYRTENFESSKKKIFINVNGGVSSFKVYRY